jgi:hypothetical protein
MKISHSELEVCLRQPRGWLREKLTTPAHPYPTGYNRALLLSIYKYHKAKQTTVARQYLRDIIQRRQFKDLARIDEIEVGFESYVRWCETENVAVADSHILIRFGSGYLTLIGEVSRVDVTSDYYRAVLLGPFEPNWQRQLRMPLIQKAISEKFARPVEEVAVSVQQLDGSDLQIRSYSTTALARAETRFKGLAQRLQQYARNFPASNP